jgi:hypothetical protein
VVVGGSIACVVTVQGEVVVIGRSCWQLCSEMVCCYGVLVLKVSGGIGGKAGWWFDVDGTG